MSSGCLPAINHGPRVAEGTTIGVVASATAGPDYDNGELDTPYLYGPIGVSIGHGMAALDENALGIYIGGHIPILAAVTTQLDLVAALAQADLYVQVPSTMFGAYDAGVGLNAGYAQFSPYIQFGRIDENGSGWHTTQGITFLPTRADYAVNELYGWLWVGSIARQWSSGGRERQAFLTGGIGQHRGSCMQSCWNEGQRYVVSVGLSLDLYRTTAP